MSNQDHKTATAPAVCLQRPCSASVGADGRCMVLTDWSGREIYLSRDEAFEMMEAIRSKLPEMAVKL